MCFIGAFCHDDPWCKFWLRIATFNSCYYDMPNGSVGRNFVTWMSSEIDLLAQGSIHSERVRVIVSTMLQQDPIVWKGMDIAWQAPTALEGTLFEDLIAETEDVHGSHLDHDLQ